MMRSTKEKAMDKATAITYVFLGIGGVLLTNRWDHHARKPAAANLPIGEEQAPLAAQSDLRLHWKVTNLFQKQAGVGRA
jgi:hypothetical protein